MADSTQETVTETLTTKDAIFIARNKMIELLGDEGFYIVDHPEDVKADKKEVCLFVIAEKSTTHPGKLDLKVFIRYRYPNLYDFFHVNSARRLYGMRKVVAAKVFESGFNTIGLVKIVPAVVK